MLLQADSRRRITLPSSVRLKPGDALDLEILEDGRIILIPVVPVPCHQLWAWTAESKQAITASLGDLRPSEVVETSEQADAIAAWWINES